MSTMHLTLAAARVRGSVMRLRMGRAAQRLVRRAIRWLVPAG